MYMYVTTYELLDKRSSSSDVNSSQYLPTSNIMSKTSLSSGFSSSFRLVGIFAERLEKAHSKSGEDLIIKIVVY